MNLTRLLRTNFSNMAPQRGFITSYQPYALVSDIDLASQTVFNAQLLESGSKKFIFIRNGPFKISLYQKYFEIHGDEQALSYINTFKFFVGTVNYTTRDDINAFAVPDLLLKEINFAKEVLADRIIFHIDDETIKILENISSIICSPDVLNLDPSYDLRIYLFHNQSEKIYYQEGYDAVISYLENIFKEQSLTGCIYKTKNGLRVILSDKIRDLEDKNTRDSTVKLLKDLLNDRGLQIGYEIGLDEPEALTNYLVRLTPKLKNYSVFDNSYETILDNLELHKLTEFNISESVVPTKYDFTTVFYSTDKTNKQIEESFELLKSLIFKYLLSKEYSVCNLIKKIEYSSEIPELKKYIEYHDKWTKAHTPSSILI